MEARPTPVAAADEPLTEEQFADEGGASVDFVGIGVGPPIERDGDYFGTTVNLAARLSGAAGPGQILAASLGSRIGVEGRALRPFGSLTLKGLPRPSMSWN